MKKNMSLRYFDSFMWLPLNLTYQGEAVANGIKAYRYIVDP